MVFDPDSHLRLGGHPARRVRLRRRTPPSLRARRCASSSRIRECVFSFASRSLRVRYKQALLGLSWAVIQPLVFLGIFILFFNKVAGVRRWRRDTYAAFALSALVPWQFVSNGVTLRRPGPDPGRRASCSARCTSHARRRCSGRSSPTCPTSSSGSSCCCSPSRSPARTSAGRSSSYRSCASLIVLPTVAVSLPIARARGLLPRLQVRAAVPGAALAVREPGRLPALDGRGTKWRPLYAIVNPVVGPLDGFAHVLASGTMPDWGLVGISTASSTVLLLVGYRIFKSLEREIADVV